MPLTSLLARACLLALFAHAAASAHPTGQPEPVASDASWDQRMDQRRASIDALLGKARQDGMALLVIPTLNLDAQGKRDFHDPATRMRFMQQSSTMMHWNHKADDGYAISVGHGEHKADIPDLGPLFQTPRGKLTYQVIPVWPGEYRLNRIAYHQMDATPPKAVRSIPVADMLAKVGIAELTPTTDRDFKKTAPWSNSAEQADDRLGNGCSLVLRLGGGCDELARVFRWDASARIALQQRQAEAVQVPGVDVLLSFSPIADITLHQGEAVLTDGFVLLDDQPVLARNLCETSLDFVRCAVQSITVQRLPASLEDFRQAPGADTFNLPQTHAALRDLVYRAPNVHAKPVAGGSPNLLRAQ
jgi:hypothetical protein